MSIQLLPTNFDDLIRQAIELFWNTRSKGAKTQGGSRGHVISGKNLDGFLGVVNAVADHCGVPKSSIFTTGKSDLTLPGYYRPNKNWDVVIVQNCRLLAALEFKSQVGSFGNNFNNRSEEVIGNASDLWVAFQNGAYHPSNHKNPPVTSTSKDPRAPFLGYLMLLQECDKSTKEVKADSAHYHLFPEFNGASYAKRYQILCERLMEQKLYDAASLVLSKGPEGKKLGDYRSLSPATGIKNLFIDLAASLSAAMQA